MPARSKIATLPDAVRRELDAKLIANGFGDYEGMARWLNEQGFQIGKSCVHEHGQKLEVDYKDAMSDARAFMALVRATEGLDDAGSELAASAATILGFDLVRTALDLRNENDTETRVNLLSKLSRAQVDLGRMAISAEKHRAEVREKIKAKLAEMERQTQGEKPKFDAATLKRVSEEFYGII